MAIKLQKDKTQLELNLQRIDEPLELLVNKISSSIHDLNTAFSNLWNLDDSSILEIANYLGPVKVQETFEAHYKTGCAMNEILTMRGVDSPRAVVVAPKEFVIDPETGVISFYVEPVPVIPEVVPEEPVI